MMGDFKSHHGVCQWTFVLRHKRVHLSQILLLNPTTNIQPKLSLFALWLIHREYGAVQKIDFAKIQ